MLASAELPSCQIYSENKCQGNEVNTADSFEDHRWFTPSRGAADYVESFQDFSVLAAHAHIEYSSDRSTAKVTILADHRDNSTLSFGFNDKWQSDNTITFDSSSATGPISLAVRGNDGSSTLSSFNS